MAIKRIDNVLEGTGVVLEEATHTGLVATRLHNQFSDIWFDRQLTRDEVAILQKWAFEKYGHLLVEETGPLLSPA